MAGEVYQDPDGNLYSIGPDGRRIELGQSQSRGPSLSSIAPKQESNTPEILKNPVVQGLAEKAIPGVGGAVGLFDLLANQKSRGAGALQGAASGAALGSVIPGLGTLAGGAIGGGLGLLKGFFNHKNTKQYEAERWSEAASKFSDKNKATVASLYKSAHAPGDKGEKWTPEVAAAAIKDPISIWGQQGMLNTFGNDYFDKMDEFQRYAAAQAAIDAGLVKNDHGDIIITNPEKLKSLTEGAYKNADYRKAYDSWKKTEKKPSLSSIAPGGQDPTVAAANVMANAQKQIANQSAQASRQQSLLGLVQGLSGQNQAQVANYGGFTGAKNPYL
jgi:hypothetical protein